jgi:Ni,Fe-hydrogenase I small subunit
MGGMGHLTISCDDCALRRSTACRDCMVSFVLAADPTVDQVIDQAIDPLTDPVIEVVHPGLDLDEEQERIVDLFAKAGLVPRLRHRAS